MTDQISNDGSGQGQGTAEGQGGGAQAWYGESYASVVSEKQWASPDAVIESYVNLEKLLGADRAGRTVALPKDENDAEGLKAFRAKIGVPETPEAYELGDTDFAKAASSWFFETGVPKSAAQALAKKWQEYFEAQMTAHDAQAKAESEKALNNLKAEWGDDFERRSEFARRGLKAYGEKAGLDEHDLNALEQVLGTAKLLKMFHTLGETTDEAQFVGGNQGGSLSPIAAKQKMDELRMKRIAGQISEKDFLAEVDRLGPIAARATA